MPALESETNADARSDADVILAIREGDVGAIDELYRRHHRAAMAFAESLAGKTLAPDLVSDAFVRILDLLQRGGGPTVVFRSYLYTTVRNLFVDHVRHHSRQTSMPDFGPLEAEFALGDGLDDRFEHSLVKRAFTSLPERWQIALWYTTVEGVSLEDAGTFLGVAPNAVAALTFRAREGLRQAYLAEHLTLTVEQTCAEVWEVLPRYVRGTLRARMLETVEEHLPTCRQCTAAVSELGQVNSSLRGVLLVALLGAGTAGYLDKVVGNVPEPIVDPTTPGAGSSGIGQARHLTKVARAAAAVGTAAAVGALVVAWPDHRGPGGGADPSTSPRITNPSTSPATPGSPQVPVHPGPRTPTSTNATVASETIGRTGPGGEVVLLGSPSSTRVTVSDPPWFHVSVPVSAPSNDVKLILEASSWRAFHVHRELGYGSWSCASNEPAVGDPVRLSCHLPAGSAGSLELGLDVQTDGKTSITVTVRESASDAETIRTFVIGG